MNTNIKTIAASIIMLAAIPAFTAAAQQAVMPKPDKTIILYPEGQAAGKGLPETQGPGDANGITDPEKCNKDGNISLISDEARIDLYFPKKPNGQMVVVCPGGGYAFVSSYNEGTYVADWMMEQGISVAVVKYRLPNGHWTVPLTDVQNAFRYCRAHAEEWGMDQIGVMGFSAGGHLAASATTMYTDRTTRPDFSILIYPVISLDWDITHGGTRENLLGSDKAWDSRDGKSYEEWKEGQMMHKRLVNMYSQQNNITTDTPPVFLAHCSDDTTVPVENSLRFYKALVGNGVPAEMHIYPTGGHGWGFSTKKFVAEDKIEYCRNEFEASLARWLSAIRSK